MDLLWDYMNEGNAATEQSVPKSATAGVNPAEQPISQEDIAFFAEATGKNEEAVAAKLKSQGVDIKEDTQGVAGEKKGDEPRADGQVPPDHKDDQANDSSAQPEVAGPVEPPNRKDWREGLGDKEMEWAKRFTSYIDSARQNLDRIAPKPTGDPESAEYKEADAYRKRVEYALRECERIDKLETDYDGDTGWFIDVNKDKVNLATVTKTIVEAVRKSAKTKEDLIDAGLDTRFTDLSVKHDDGREEIGMKIDKTEFSEVENRLIINQSKLIFRELQNRIEAYKMFEDSSQYQNAMDMFSEYLILLNEPGLPADLQIQLVSECLHRLSGAKSSEEKGVLDGIASEYNNPVTGKQERISAKELTRSAKISDQETRERTEGGNPFANWLIDRLVEGRATLNGELIESSNTEAIEKLKHGIFGKNLEKDAMEGMGLLERLVRDQKVREAHPVARFFLKEKINLSEMFKTPELDGFSVDIRGIRTVIQKLTGSADGFTRQRLAELDQKDRMSNGGKSNINKYAEKFKQLKLRGISWENWGIGMLLAYSLFGPMMGEGEDERQQQ